MELGRRRITDSYGGSLKRLAESSNYEMSDAELGEPSAEPSSDCTCECDCGTLAEELADMKAMIGRLIRNGEES